MAVGLKKSIRPERAKCPLSFGTTITNHVRSPVAPEHRRRNAESGRFLETRQKSLS